MYDNGPEQVGPAIPALPRFSKKKLNYDPNG